MPLPLFSHCSLMALGFLVTAKLVPRTLNKAAINNNLILVELEDTWRQLKGVLDQRW